MPGGDNDNYHYHVKWMKKRALSQELKAKRLGGTPRPGAGRRSGAEATSGPPGALTGMVAQATRISCVVLHDEALVPCDFSEATVPPEAETIVVGDRVIFDLRAGRGILRQVLPRSSRLVRMRTDRSRLSVLGKDEHILAANIDVAVIVAAAASPPFRPRLIDRYLVMCQYGGVAPLICVNKCDLVAERPDLGFYQRLGVPMVFTSTATGDGMEELRTMLRGKCAVLTGHSGVGKSSILNRLLEREAQAARPVSTGDGRGRHTTTASNLHRLDADTCLIDTPGIRSLGLWEISRDTLPWYFPEFQRQASGCKFRDCLHIHEPGCGVKAAVTQGDIAPERYESYLRLAQE